MPYIHLRHTDVAAACAAAPRLAAAVAQQLALGPGDVLVSVSAASGIYDGRGPVADWPSAIIHGRARSEDAMARATAAAVTTLADALAVDRERVWVHWSTG